MKKVLGIIFVFLHFICFTQEKTEETITVIPTVEAAFKGGKAKFNEFLMNNLVYPQTALENNLTGKAYVQFKINENGELSEFSLKKGVVKCPECDEEAMRVLKLMPNWIPATLNNKNISSFYTIPIYFQLD